MTQRHLNVDDVVRDLVSDYPGVIIRSDFPSTDHGMVILGRHGYLWAVSVVRMGAGRPDTTACCTRCGQDAEATHMCDGLLVPPRTHHGLAATRELEWDDDDDA